MTSVFIGNNQVATLGSGTAASPLNVSVGNNDIVTAGNDVSMVAGNNDTIIISDSNFLMVGNNDTVTAGSNDTIIANNNDTISMGTGVLSLGSNGSVTLSAGTTLTVTHLGSNDVLHDGGTVVNGRLIGGGNTFNFGTLETATLFGTGDTLNAAAGDVITIGGSGGADPTRSVFSIGSGTTGATINGGLGIDTFSPGTGYQGGNDYIGSAHSNADGFAGIGNRIDYASTRDANGHIIRVVADLNAGTGSGYDGSGNLLWTDAYNGMQQVVAAGANGNVLIGSDSFYTELVGSAGSVTYDGGAAGDRIIWSSADASGVANAGNGLDVAYAGSGADEFYWRNQPHVQGASNFGQTIYQFSVALDGLNFSEWTTVGAPFANVSGRNFDPTVGNNGLVNDLFNWVGVTLDGSGNTDVLFDKFGDGNSQHFQTAAVLEGVNLFDVYGVSPASPGASQQVVEDLYFHNGHSVLVFNQTH
jgi:hypothetical protein